MRRFLPPIAVTAVLAAAACSAPPAAGHRSADGNPPAPPTRPTVRITHSSSPPPLPPAVTVSHFRAADGSVVTLARFSGTVTYRLHAGSTDPGQAALSVVHAGPGISGAERRHLLAAFNGGFLLSAGAGGYEQEGHVIARLRSGLASLVIDRSGAAHIGVWGAGLPRRGEAVYSVRQNLQPLVRAGRVTVAATDWTAWGATLGGGEYVARSAVGQNAAGDLIFAGSMSTTPGDLAAALVHAAAFVAMELDINPEWVQLDVARRPGRPLRAAIPGQNRPANQYLYGWTRDFITVLGA